MPRYIQIDDWIFEVKTVRALRVKNYGEPYTAIANININGDNVYIDGLLTRDQQFSKQDYQTFVNFCQQLAIKNVAFDRFKNLEAFSNLHTVKSSVA
jgi:hypothetical protein